MFQLLFQNLAMLFVWSNDWHISNDWSNIYRENYHLVGGGPDVDLLSTKCQKSITNLHNDPNFDVGTSACENLSNIFFRNVEVHIRQIRVRLQTVKNNCNDKTTRLLSILEKNNDEISLHCTWKLFTSRIFPLFSISSALFKFSLCKTSPEGRRKLHIKFLGPVW